ncbi:ABC transporter transmembrane region 2-domain-containing protein [Phlebopus sp. FC_14]|nr:ABC transporter transmembrane region 2-domain-containing protein [Phlebopus sp. FC_14]
MAAVSKLRPSDKQLADYARAYAAHRPLVQRGLMIGFVLYVLLTSYKGIAARPPPKLNKGKDPSFKDSKSARVAVDGVFYQRLRIILRIVIPGIRSKEALLLPWMESEIVASLVRGQSFQFLLYIIRWLLVAVPATWTNSWLSYVQNKLAIAYRTRLTREVLKQYLGDDAEGPEGKVYYKLSNLDDRIKNPDQMITHDIQHFSSHLAAIYANLAKPILDVILYNYQLAQNVGAEGLVLLTILIQSSGALLRAVTPSFGTYTAESAALAGSFRHAHSRLAEFAEEVAFFGGEEVERQKIEKEYIALVEHEQKVMNKKWWYGCAEEGIVKWLWGSFGLVVCAIPVFFRLPGISNVDLSSRTEGFVTNRRLLLSSSDAIGRVMYSYKDLAELAGYTTRVFSLLETMSDVRAGKFEKTFLSSAREGKRNDIMRGRGQVFEAEDIQFENVPIVTPNGDLLLENLTFNVKPGEHLLIVGPNGAGKSSLFRILGGLWPVYGGVVRKPRASDFMLIPQRPYLPLGTLRDQVIYPHSQEQMEARGVSNADLFSILTVVQMEGVVEREGGWDTVSEWRDALSGGDKQKIAWARLFYHKPKYAILDEATSLVPLDMEGKMMEHATALGITLLTVSHRPSLWKYHSTILQLDGQGRYVFTKLDAERRLALQEEKLELEAKLLEVPKMQSRLAELRSLANARRTGSVT